MVYLKRIQQKFKTHRCLYQCFCIIHCLERTYVEAGNEPFKLILNPHVQPRDPDVEERGGVDGRVITGCRNRERRNRNRKWVDPQRR